VFKNRLRSGNKTNYMKNMDDDGLGHRRHLPSVKWSSSTSLEPILMVQWDALTNVKFAVSPMHQLQGVLYCRWWWWYECCSKYNIIGIFTWHWSKINIMLPINAKI